VNKMIKTKVKTYLKKGRRGKFKVKAHARRKRKVGARVVKTKRVGTFVLQFDKYGNIKGTKIIKFKKSK